MNGKRATIDDVAKHANVSIATVSRVVTGSQNVSTQTALRVQAAVQELGYRPNIAAKMLAGQRTYTLGLVVDEIAGEFFQHMLRGIERTADDNGYDILIHSTRALRHGVYPVGEHNTDGLIIFSNSLPEEELLRLYAKGFPMILMHQSPPKGLQIPCVTIQNKDGARQMTDYLIEQRGYRQIAFLRGPEFNEDSHWREIGYRESLQAHGIEPDENLMGLGNFDEAIAHHTVTQWIRQGKRPQVIFASDDDSAIGVMMALREANIRVPQDIAVVGFDDIRLGAYLTPALTTVRAPIEKVSQLAVQQLLNLMKTGEADLLTLLPTELIIRESCGCC